MKEGLLVPPDDREAQSLQNCECELEVLEEGTFVELPQKDGRSLISRPNTIVSQS